MAGDQTARQDFRASKILAGLGITAFAVLLAGAPWPFALATLAPAAVAHAAVFDWGLRREDSFPAMGAFAIGLLLDVVSGPIFGLGALTCVIAHYAAATQRRFLGPRGLGHAWIGFALTAFILAPIAWTIASLAMFQTQPIGPTLAQATLTAALYPPLALIFAGIRSAIGLGGRPI